MDPLKQTLNAKVRIVDRPDPDPLNFQAVIGRTARERDTYKSRLRELVAAVKATDATQHTRHIHELAAEIDRELNPQQPDDGRKE
jgi:hypothetical protein